MAGNVLVGLVMVQVTTPARAYELTAGVLMIATWLVGVVLT